MEIILFSHTKLRYTRAGQKLVKTAEIDRIKFFTKLNHLRGNFSNFTRKLHSITLWHVNVAGLYLLLTFSGQKTHVLVLR